MLAIFIDMRLLRRNPNPNPCSLSWALFVTQLELLITVLLGAAFLLIPGTIQFFGKPTFQALPGPGFALNVGVFAFFYWQLKVLTNQQVRAVFNDELNESASE